MLKQAEARIRRQEWFDRLRPYIIGGVGVAMVGAVVGGSFSTAETWKLWASLLLVGGAFSSFWSSYRRSREEERAFAAEWTEMHDEVYHAIPFDDDIYVQALLTDISTALRASPFAKSGEEIEVSSKSAGDYTIMYVSDNAMRALAAAKLVPREAHEIRGRDLPRNRKAIFVGTVSTLPPADVLARLTD